VVTFGRAGEDNKSFRLNDIETTLAGFAQADSDMQARREGREAFAAEGGRGRGRGRGGVGSEICEAREREAGQLLGCGCFTAASLPTCLPTCFAAVCSLPLCRTL
jgi:hypothetical protein